MGKQRTEEVLAAYIKGVKMKDKRQEHDERMTNLYEKLMARAEELSASQGVNLKESWTVTAPERRHLPIDETGDSTVHKFILSAGKLNIVVFLDEPVKRVPVKEYLRVIKENGKYVHLEAQPFNDGKDYYVINDGPLFLSLGVCFKDVITVAYESKGSDSILTLERWFSESPLGMEIPLDENLLDNIIQRLLNKEEGQ